MKLPLTIGHLPGCCYLTVTASHVNQYHQDKSPGGRPAEDLNSPSLPFLTCLLSDRQASSTSLIVTPCLLSILSSMWSSISKESMYSTDCFLFSPQSVYGPYTFVKAKTSLSLMRNYQFQEFLDKLFLFKGKFGNLPAWPAK